MNRTNSTTYPVAQNLSDNVYTISLLTHALHKLHGVTDQPWVY